MPNRTAHPPGAFLTQSIGDFDCEWETIMTTICAADQPGSIHGRTPSRMLPFLIMPQTAGREGGPKMVGANGGHSRHQAQQDYQKIRSVPLFLAACDRISNVPCISVQRCFEFTFLPAPMQGDTRQGFRFFATCHPGLEPVVAAELGGPSIRAQHISCGKAGVEFWCAQQHLTGIFSLSGSLLS